MGPLSGERILGLTMGLWSDRLHAVGRSGKAVYAFLCLASCILVLAGCSHNGTPPIGTAPKVARTLPVTRQLMLLPPPERVIDVGVYSFPDLSGQNKPNENFAEFSRAVTQGAASYLTEALLRAGRGRWFTVTERGNLDNLLQERRIIRGTREQYEGNNGPVLPPLRFAGIMLAGGIIGYDSNVRTGGAGARWLGIGTDVQYRRDVVTVGLRAISVQSGKVLAAVSTTKTIYSIAARTNVFRFVAVDELLDVDTGFSINEPPQLAVRQAVELAVYALVLEGALNGLWSFADKTRGREVLGGYVQTRYEGLDMAALTDVTEQVEKATDPDFGRRVVTYQGLQIEVPDETAMAKGSSGLQDSARLPKVF